MITRRHLLQSGLAAAATVSFGPGFWRDALAAAPHKGNGPYGPLRPPDANGLQLPAGFTSRVIAKANELVPGTGYLFPVFPDGQATFPTPDGGWILVTNSEIPLVGGVSAIRFDASGKIVDAYRILGNTSTNCAGGPTPWGTWLSCEEVDEGAVFECDPTGARDAVEHRAMGIFKHEAACVDPIGQQVYLSEDVSGGGLYRYTPEDYPDLARGLLEIACKGDGDRVVWKAVPDPLLANGTPTRDQVAGAIDFARGEGIWYDAGIVYLATTSDETIHAYDTRSGRLGVVYRADDVEGTPLRGVDNVLVSRSGDVFVAEDSYDNDPDAMDVCLITPEREVARFLKVTGAGHDLGGDLSSETVGICFDPSGTRMYFGSQRWELRGIVYEVTGPFRQERPAGTAPAGGLPGAAVPTTVAGLGRGTGSAGTPIGLDVPRRQQLVNLLRRGLPVGLTLDRAATVRVTLTARLSVKGRKRRTVTLARGTFRAGRGHRTLRVKPLKAVRAVLRARRHPLKATLRVRITTPGAPARTLTRTVTLGR